MKSFDKKIIDSINGDTIDYKKIIRVLTCAGTLGLLCLIASIKEKTYDHTKGISPVTKVLSYVNLDNDILSLGTKYQLKKMKEDLKDDNATINYYGYVIFEDKIEINKEALDTYIPEKGYEIVEEKVPYGIKITNDLDNEIKVEKKYTFKNEDGKYYELPEDYEKKYETHYYAVKQRKEKNVYEIDYEGYNNDIYLTNHGNYKYYSSYLLRDNKKDQTPYHIKEKSLIKKIY